MQQGDIIEIIVRILVIIGALNWGIIAAGGKDVVPMLVGGNENADKTIKIIVGAAAVYFAYLTFTKYAQKPEEEAPQE